MPGLRSDDRVELPTGGLPGLEPRHVDRQPAGSGELGHPRVGFDAEHAAAGSLELARGNAGAAADIEQIASRASGDDPRHERFGVARPSLVIALRVDAERLGHLPGLMQFGRGRFGMLGR